MPLRSFGTALLILLCCLGAWAEDIGPGRHPALAADANGHLFLVYEGLEVGEDIWFRRSDDVGRTWSQEVRISKTPGISKNPEIAVESSGAIDVVWQDSQGEEKPEIYFTRSTDGGKTWSAAQNLSNSPDDNSIQPRLAIGPDDSLHVVWVNEVESGPGPGLYYTYSYNHGKSWTKRFKLSTTPGISSSPVVTVAKDSTVHVVWLFTSSGAKNPDIYHTFGAGDTWTKPVNVSHSPGRSRRPDVAITPKGSIFVSWADTSRRGGGHFDIWITHSSGDGQFSRPFVFLTPGYSTQPALNVGRDGHLALVWADTSEDPEAPEIYLSQSSDGGKSFTRPRNVSRTPGLSLAPDLVIGQDQIVVVWEEIGKDKGHSFLKVTRVPRQRGAGR